MLGRDVVAKAAVDLPLGGRARVIANVLNINREGDRDRKGCFGEGNWAPNCHT